MRVSLISMVTFVVAALVLGCGDVSGAPPVTDIGGGGDRGTELTFECTEEGIRDAIETGEGPHDFACDGPTTVVTREEIVIDKDVLLDGGGNLTVDASFDHRAFSVQAGVTAELRGITIMGGSAWPEQHGGGVSNDGNLVLRDCFVSRNHATIGGGLYSSGALTLIDSVVVENTANFGGGLATSGWLIVRDSFVGANEAADGRGGGIFSESGTSILIGATVSQNAARFGGGIFNLGKMSVAASTVSENRAGSSDVDSGGGIFNEIGVLHLEETVVSKNTGGGVCNCRSTVGGGNGTLTVRGSGVSSNDGRGLVNVATASILDSIVIANARGGISNEGRLRMDGCLVYGGLSAFGGASEVHVYETLIQGGCTGDGATLMVSEGHNTESPGNTCHLDHPTDEVNKAVGLGQQLY